MIFSEIIQELEKLCRIDLISSGSEEEISEVQFLDLRQKHVRPNILYFTSHINEEDSLPPNCIISAQAADRLPAVSGVNLAAVSESDFGYVFNTVSQLIEDSYKDGYYESMMKTLDRVRDVDTLIDIGSQTFGASLVFIDREFRILSYSTQIPITDELWKHNIEQGYCDYEFIQTVKSLKSVQMADSSMNPIEVSCSSSPFQKFSSRVYCRDIWIGFLIVIESHDSYRPEHVEMLRTLSGVLGFAVMKYAPSFLYMTSDYHRFLYNLIIGADMSSLPEAYAHLTFPSELIVMYCKATGDHTLFPQEGPLSESLTMILPGCHIIARRDSAAIIGSSEIIHKVGTILTLFPEKSKTKIGVSLPFNGIASLKARYDEACDAFSIGFLLDPDLSIYTFEDYGIYAMFKSVAEREDLSRYLHPALPKLAEYDRDNCANLELTLHTYLKCACNTTETAEALFLHRNSVIYRLHRIEELCDVDLDDTDTRFRLRLSYAISNVINQKRKWAGKDFSRV